MTNHPNRSKKALPIVQREYTAELRARHMYGDKLNFELTGTMATFEKFMIEHEAHRPDVKSWELVLTPTDTI